MLDLDAVVDLDTPAFDLDGFAGQPVIAHGGGTPVHFKPFIAVHDRIVAQATATFGPLEAHAVAVKTFDVLDDEDELLLLL